MSKFFRPGVSKVMVLPAIAGTSPTRAEINAGTDISSHVAGLPGFSLNNERKETPHFGQAFVPTIDGPDKAGDPRIQCWDDDTVTTVRTLLAKGTTTFILLMPYGDVPTKRCEKWQIKSTGVNDDEWSTSDPARFTVSVAILSSPVQSGVIPA